MSNRNDDFMSWAGYQHYYGDDSSGGNADGGGSGCFVYIFIAAFIIAGVAFLFSGGLVGFLISLGLFLIIFVLYRIIKSHIARGQRFGSSIRLNSDYREAVKLFEQGDFKQSSEAFEKLGSFKDSRQFTIYCRARYFETLAAKDPLLFIEALKAYHSLFISFRDSSTRIESITSNLYDYADSQFSKSDYDTAIECFSAIQDYKDSKDRAESAFQLSINHKKTLAKTLGNTIYFGHYEQGNDHRDPVEWVVIASENSKSLLLSKYAIDINKFQDTLFDKAKWEDSSIRKWLNSEFLGNTFSPAEQDHILDLIIPNNIILACSGPAGPYKKSSPGGEGTKDKIFFLSNDEAQKYLTDINLLKCKPTKFAEIKSKNTIQNPDELKETINGGFSSWWLRSMSTVGSCAVCVDCDGKINTWGKYSHVFLATRPAFWLNTSV